jgi:hypothetical protein
MYHVNKTVIAQAEPGIIGKGEICHTNAIFEEGRDGMGMDKNSSRSVFSLFLVQAVLSIKNCPLGQGRAGGAVTIGKFM